MLWRTFPHLKLAWDTARSKNSWLFANECPNPLPQAPSSGDGIWVQVSDVLSQWTGRKWPLFSSSSKYRIQECILNTESHHTKPELFIPQEDNFKVRGALMVPGLVPIFPQSRYKGLPVVVDPTIPLRVKWEGKRNVIPLAFPMDFRYTGDKCYKR